LASSSATEDEQGLAADAIEWLLGKRDEPKPAAVKQNRNASSVTSQHRHRHNPLFALIAAAALPIGGFISMITDVTSLSQAEAELARGTNEIVAMHGSVRTKCLLAVNWAMDRRPARRLRGLGLYMSTALITGHGSRLTLRVEESRERPRIRLPSANPVQSE